MDANELRTLADAQPVAAVPAGWKPVPVEPTPEMLSSVGMMDGYDWHAPGCSPDADHANWYSAMIAAAPAAPQAEPMADSDADYWLRNRQPILDAIERAGFMLMSNASGFWLHPRGKTDAQAGPKREDQPLRDLLAVIHCDGGHHTEAVGLDQSIKDAQAAVCELKRELAMAKREPLSDERIAEIQRAAYERAAQECEHTAATGSTEDVWDAGYDTGCNDCADVIRALKTNEEQGNE